MKYRSTENIKWAFKYSLRLEKDRVKSFQSSTVQFWWAGALRFLLFCSPRLWIVVMWVTASFLSAWTSPAILLWPLFINKAFPLTGLLLNGFFCLVCLFLTQFFATSRQYWRRSMLTELGCFFQYWCLTWSSRPAQFYALHCSYMIGWPHEWTRVKKCATLHNFLIIFHSYKYTTQVQVVLAVTYSIISPCPWQPG